MRNVHDFFVSNALAPQERLYYATSALKVDTTHICHFTRLQEKILFACLTVCPSTLFPSSNIKQFYGLDGVNYTWGHHWTMDWRRSPIL